MYPELPPELYDKIFSFLQGDRPALQSCSLTCQAWTDVAQRHLYHTLILRDDLSNSACQRGVWILASSPNLARQVKRLELHGTTANILTHLAPHLTQVRYLLFNAQHSEYVATWSVWSAVSHHFAQLRFLSVRCVEVPANEILYLLCACSQIEKLDLTCCTIQRPSSDVPSFPDLSSNVPHGLRSLNLRIVGVYSRRSPLRFGINGFLKELAGLLENGTLKLPGLKSLTIAIGAKSANAPTCSMLLREIAGSLQTLVLDFKHYYGVNSTKDLAGELLGAPDLSLHTLALHLDHNDDLVVALLSQRSTHTLRHLILDISFIEGVESLLEFPFEELAEALEDKQFLQSLVFITDPEAEQMIRDRMRTYTDRGVLYCRTRYNYRRHLAKWTELAEIEMSDYE